MNNLQKRIFLILTSILSTFLVILLIIFNVSLYDTEKSRSAEMSIRIEQVLLRPSENPKNNKELILMNEKIAKKHLSTALFLSLLFGLILEAFIIYISKIIAKWITRPVEEAFSKQKQFISDASHELKTPLAIIQANAEILEANPKEKKYLESIKNETKKMNKLVGDLLELSRTEGEKTKIVFSKTNLSKLVKNKSLSFESLMFENKMTLETKIEPEIMFSCDKEKIKELLSILLDNAIKYGDKNSKITVELSKSKNNIILNIKNKGKEIEPREREKIFERFYRVDKSRNRKDGSFGLGLSIAKNIVELHHGVIKVECKDGFTVFKIIFY